ncbi:hypothetical protein SAMN05421856_101413 [Chryseobacterium taichungense]|uniref:Uncharacterized protein n=1 Tax=Chryseobacterium taichungense TaxID=295069 RepID=A0A1H7W1H1_9FLAO|nr:hypothetical protein SAMN05421856_101413 [Chryseobacterium taichungense]
MLFRSVILNGTTCSEESISINKDSSFVRMTKNATKNYPQSLSFRAKRSVAWNLSNIYKILKFLSRFLRNDKVCVTFIFGTVH